MTVKPLKPFQLFSKHRFRIPILLTGITVQHLQRFRADAKKHGNLSNVISPMVLPAYTREE